MDALFRRFTLTDSASQEDKILQQVQGLLNLRWGAQKIILTGTMKTGQKGTVFSALMGGEPVVVKKTWKWRGRRGFVRRTALALRHLGKQDSRGNYWANRYLAGSFVFGLVVVSFETGTPLEKLLLQAPARRAALIDECCNWLTWASGDHVTDCLFRPGLFRKEINRIVDGAAEHQEAALVRSLGAALHRMLPGLDGTPVQMSAGHPDFAPRNLIVSEGGGLAGVDIHKNGEFYRARQAAIFLVSKDYDIQPQRDLMYGLDLVELRHFLSKGLVAEAEINKSFVFFVGLTFLRMYSTRPGKRKKSIERRARILSYLDDVNNAVEVPQ